MIQFAMAEGGTPSPPPPWPELASGYWEAPGQVGQNPRCSEPCPSLQGPVCTASSRVMHHWASGWKEGQQMPRRLLLDALSDLVRIPTEAGRLCVGGRHCLNLLGLQGPACTHSCQPQAVSLRLPSSPLRGHTGLSTPLLSTSHRALEVAFPFLPSFSPACLLFFLFHHLFLLFFLLSLLRLFFPKVGELRKLMFQSWLFGLFVLPILFFFEQVVLEKPNGLNPSPTGLYSSPLEVSKGVTGKQRPLRLGHEAGYRPP